MRTKGLTKIGEGLFSKVYRLNDKQVLIKSVCYVKECISMDWHNSTGIFPTIERVDDQTYIMDYYQKVKSVKNALLPEYYALYKELRALSIGYVKNKHDCYSEWCKQFETVSNTEYRDALLDMVGNLTNYGTTIKFEISPRNIAVKDGKLILLDVFFFSDQAEEQRKSKRKVYSH